MMTYDYLDYDLTLIVRCWQPSEYTKILTEKKNSG